MSTIILCMACYLKQPRQSTTVHIFVPAVSGLPSSVEAQIRIKLPRVLQLQSSSLRVADAALWQSGFNWPSHASRYRSSWNIWMHSFKIYGKWSVQANKQASKHTHARAQCSHASVGLTQARPNYWAYTSLEKQILGFLLSYVYDISNVTLTDRSTYQQVMMQYCISITIVQSCTRKCHEFVAVCIVTSVQHE